MRVVGAEELRARLSMTAAIDALDAAFAAEEPDLAAPLRSTLDTAAGSLLLMPATGEQGTGVKLVTLTHANPAAGLPFVNAAYVLFDRTTQVAEVVFDGAALTALRTAAVSGLATRYLARDDARSLVLFGAGVQATSHLQAMTAVRALERLVVVSRTSERAEGLVALGRALGLDSRIGTPDDVATADIVCTCTTSTEPVVQGRLLGTGTHVNAVGAYLPDTREVDTETVVRSRCVVETRAVAEAEAGDLLVPRAEGAAVEVLADLRELVTGTEVRRSPEDLTLFVSVGMAFEDLVVARTAMEALT